MVSVSPSHVQQEVASLSTRTVCKFDRSQKPERGWELHTTKRRTFNIVVVQGYCASGQRDCRLKDEEVFGLSK